MTYARKGMARIIAILCSLVMTFGLLGVAPKAAFADEGRYEITVSCQVSSSDAVEGEVKETSATGSATVHSETLPTKVTFDQSSGVTHPLNSALYKLLNVSSVASYVTTDRDHDKTSSNPTKKEHPGSFTAEAVGTTAYAGNPIYYEVTVSADKVVHVKANYSITVKDTQPQNNVTNEETTPKLDESEIPTELEENSNENAETPNAPEATQNEGVDTTQGENQEAAATAESEPEFTITAIPAMNGTLSVYQETAEAGTTVSLAAKPNEGYVLDYVSVKDEDGNTYDVVKDEEQDPEQAAGETFHFTMPAQDVTVSAVFDSLYYEVVFDANGGDGTMANQTIEFGKATALTKGAFTRDGFTFTGWNTSADGSGASYTDEQAVTDIASQENPTITLFAQWEKDEPAPLSTVTISFDANGGKGTMADQSADADTATPLNKNSFTREGYSFDGWNTAADGSGASYADGASVTASTDLTLYAQWEKNPEPVKTVTISFDANGGKGTMDKQVAKKDAQTTLNANTFTREGFTFTGWNTKADGTGATYGDKVTVQFDADITLYAQWKKSPAPQTDVKVTFEANGGKGTMDKQTIKKNTETALNANKYARQGYSFTGWNTKADGKGAAYKDKASVKLDANLTLYAQWKKNATPANRRSATPSTGDPMSMVAIISMAGVGIAAIAAGRASKRR